MYVYYEIGLTEFCNWFHFAICINFLPCVKVRQLERFPQKTEIQIVQFNDMQVIWSID